MQAFRIGDPHGEHPIWSDGGARIASGRWHEAGARVIYASEHYSTAMLEKLVQYSGEMPSNQHFITVTIPAGTSCEVANVDLIQGWASPDGEAARRFGRDWYGKKRYVGPGNSAVNNAAVGKRARFRPSAREGGPLRSPGQIQVGLRRRRTAQEVEKAFAKVVGVAGHLGDQCRAVAVRDRLDYLQVLPDRELEERRVAAIGVVHPPVLVAKYEERDPAREIRQLPRVTRNEPVLSRRGEPMMKLGVRRRHAQEVELPGPPLISRLDQPEIVHETGIAEDQDGRDRALGQDVGLEELARVRQGQWRDPQPAVSPRLDEAL